MAQSDYLSNKLLDHSFARASYTMPGTVYVGLFTASPGDDDSGSGNELDAADYARQVLTIEVAASRATSNSAEITWAVAASDWAITPNGVSHWGVYDALTTGNLLWHGAFTIEKDVGTGDQAKIAANDLDFSFTAS